MHAGFGADEAMAQLSPAVRIRAMQLTQLCRSDRDKALACHRFVRAIPLAEGPLQPPDTVLSRRAGAALSKADLLIALLRASGVDAHLRVYSVRAEFLGGTPLPHLTVPHAMMEARVAGRWVRDDTFRLSVRQTLSSRRRLLEEGRRWGHGVHLGGAASWDGLHDAFSFISAHDPQSLPLHDWGAFADANAFLAGLRDLQAGAGRREALRGWAQRLWGTAHHFRAALDGSA